MKTKITISLEIYQMHMLQRIEEYIKKETNLYIPNRSTLIGYLIQIIDNDKELLNKK